jgi:hypothetical protein
MSKRIKKRFMVFDREGGAPRTVELVGRFAWAMGQLIDARSKGITTLENPAPRLSGYIHRLRHSWGIPIASEDEQHDGPYAGRHVRYRLSVRAEFADDQPDPRPAFQHDASRPGMLL